MSVPTGRSERSRAPRALAAGALAVLLALTAACSSGDDDDDAAGGSGDGDASAETTTGDAAEGEGAAELPEGYDGYESESYADDANWLCKPGIADDVCSRDLDATVVNADGSTEPQPFARADDPPIDCFYVYPTTSQDQTQNSDFEPGEGEEISTVWNQTARLASTCRVFAPVYRQVTLAVIGGGGEAQEGVDPRTRAYDDVVDAFKEYVANLSEGRGFVLIGHSQGAGLINRLMQDEIDDEPLLRDRLVGAYVLGSSVAVPEGEVVGGDLQNIPLCQAEDETGCVVTYASFRSTAPPPDGSLFGRPRDGAEVEVAGCVNPASPSGGSAALHPYFLIEQPEGSLLGGSTAAQPFDDPARTAEIETPWVTYPDLVTAECVSERGFSYLELTVHGDPADPRTDDIGGDLTPEWGMHLIDANVAMGDIEAMVTAQAEAYTG